MNATEKSASILRSESTGASTGSAQLIVEIRRELRLTQEEFAHVIGVTVSTVNRWENGHVEPSRLARKTIELLARRAGLPGAVRVADRPF